jgi:flagellin
VGLRINTNVAALNAARTLRRTTLDLNVNLERLSSGLRINRAKDDAAGLAISESFRTIIRGSLVAQRNCQDGISMLQTAEGALQETTNMLQRMRELAVQSSNGTMSEVNRKALDDEVKQLLAQINTIAWDTEFNGVRVLSGSTRLTLQNGIHSGQNIVVSTTGASVSLLGLNTLNITSMTTANAALSTVDLALRSVTSIRSTFGAQHNRLEFTISVLAITEENSSAADSALRDADIARETITFTRNQILVSAGTSVLAQSNVIPQTALQLLGG